MNTYLDRAIRENQRKQRQVRRAITLAMKGLYEHTQTWLYQHRGWANEIYNKPQPYAPQGIVERPEGPPPTWVLCRRALSDGPRQPVPSPRVTC